MKMGGHHTEETRKRMSQSQQLRRMKRPQATTLSEGDMVVCPDGSVGLLSHLRIRSACAVQFGSAGPFRRHMWTVLRRATVDEIKDAGLWDVGCNQGYE